MGNFKKGIAILPGVCLKLKTFHSRELAKWGKSGFKDKIITSWKSYNNKAKTILQSKVV